MLRPFQIFGKRRRAYAIMLGDLFFHALQASDRRPSSLFADSAIDLPKSAFG